MPDPSNPSDRPEPTEAQLLALMHADELQSYKSPDVPAAQKEAILEARKAQWKEVHKPITEAKMDEAPERPAKQFKCDDDDTPVNRPPFANPSEEWLRRDRINRAIQSGQQPDPADVAEEGGEKIRYQRRVAEAHSEKIKDALSPEPSESKGKPSPADREPAMPLASSPSADPAGDITP